MLFLNLIFDALQQVVNQIEKSEIDPKNSSCMLNKSKIHNIYLWVIFGQIICWCSGGNTCVNQSFYEILITLIGMICEKEALIKGCVCYIFASLLYGLNKSTCQMKKNVFYFTSKPIFVLEKIKI